MPIVLDAKSKIRECQRLNAAGHFAEAMEVARDCLALAENPDSKWQALTAIGNTRRSSGDHTAALDALTAALKVAEGDGDLAHIAMSWSNIGFTFLAASSFDLAIECFSRVTENPSLVRAWPPYQPHANLALCHLHLDDIRAGLEEIGQALRLETPALIERNPHSPVTFRHTFIQLALQSNRVGRAEMETRAREAQEFAAAWPQAKSAIIVNLILGGMEIGFGDKSRGIRLLEDQLEPSETHRHVRTDVLFALVQAERLAGRPERALHYLSLWAKHLHPTEERPMRLLKLESWMRPGARLNEQIRELSICPVRLSATLSLI